MTTDKSDETETYCDCPSCGEPGEFDDNRFLCESENCRVFQFFSRRQMIA